MLASLFFVSVRKDLATRYGCALRSACRGVSERQWRSAANRPSRQARPSPSALLLAFPIRSPLFSTVPILSSTQNAPGFAFLGPNRVRFPLFLCFSGAKFSASVLFTLPHSGYKLKPSVIPCKREVSFLT